MNSEVAAESNAQTVWLVDDNLGEADAYQRLFARGGLGNVEVKGLQNVHHKHLCAPCGTDRRTGAFIIDHNLSDQSGVQYNGLDLADFLRTLRPELPVFILTNYARDPELEEHAGSAESAIPEEKRP